jgi:hypothetical protein
MALSGFAVVHARTDGESRGQVGAYSAYDDQTFPRVDITLEDMERSGEQFTAVVLKPEAAFQ